MGEDAGGGEGDFPFFEQLDYTVRGPGKNSLLMLSLPSPASALAHSTPVFLAGILASLAFACEISLS